MDKGKVTVKIKYIPGITLVLKNKKGKLKEKRVTHDKKEKV